MKKRQRNGCHKTFLKQFLWIHITSFCNPTQSNDVFRISTARYFTFKRCNFHVKHIWRISHTLNSFKCTHFPCVLLWKFSFIHFKSHYKNIHWANWRTFYSPASCLQVTTAARKTCCYTGLSLASPSASARPSPRRSCSGWNVPLRRTITWWEPSASS